MSRGDAASTIEWPQEIKDKLHIIWISDEALEFIYEKPPLWD